MVVAYYAIHTLLKNKKKVLDFAGTFLLGSADSRPLVGVFYDF